MTEAEARRWCDCLEAEVFPYAHHGRTMYAVKVVGLHPADDERLEVAVEHLDSNVAHAIEWGRPGARVDRLRAGREQFLSRSLAA